MGTPRLNRATLWERTTVYMYPSPQEGDAVTAVNGVDVQDGLRSLVREVLLGLGLGSTGLACGMGFGPSFEA